MTSGLSIFTSFRFCQHIKDDSLIHLKGQKVSNHSLSYRINMEKMEGRAMKAFLLNIVVVTLLLFNVNASADKVVITGSPIVVHDEQGTYVTTTTVDPGRDYYYFTIDGTNRVCYQQVNPSLVDLNAAMFKVKIGDDVVSLHCYDYSPDYFVIQ